MIRFWKLFCFSATVFWYASRMTLTGRFLSPSERLRKVALIQKNAGKKLCSILGVDVRVKGNTAFDGPRLIVSNHVGLLDTWALASVFPVTFAAKVEIRDWPVIGWVGTATGLIYVDRDNKMQTGTFVSSIRERMRNDIGVLVFPEGTTNSRLELLRFKTGGFAAVENMEDGFIVPVYMWAKKINQKVTSGHERCLIAWPEGENMWQNAWKIVGYRDIEIELLVGTRIPTHGQDRKALARLAQDQVDHLRRSTLELATKPV